MLASLGGMPVKRMMPKKDTLGMGITSARYFSFINPGVLGSPVGATLSYTLGRLPSRGRFTLPARVPGGTLTASQLKKILDPCILPEEMMKSRVQHILHWAHGS